MGTKKNRLRQSQNTNEVLSSGMYSRDYRYRDLRFRESGGAKNMNVDGSSTPVDFFLGPPSGEIWQIKYLTLLLIDPGVMAHNVFGSLVAGLANGVELLEKINSVENIYTLLEDNADIAQCFFGGNTSQGLGGADPGFLDEIDQVTGRMTFEVPPILDGDDGDQMIIRINDDLQLLTIMAGSAHVAIPKVIPA